MLKRTIGIVMVAGLAGCSFDTSGATKGTPSGDGTSNPDAAGVDLAVPSPDAVLSDAPDLAPPDAGPPDGALDLSLPDMAPDAAQPDAAPDLGTPDVALTDVQTPDMPSLPDAPWPDLVPSPDTFNPLAPFSAPQPLTALNSLLDEDDPTLTGDMLEIYFDRDHDIYRSTRSSLTAAWSTPQAVTQLNSADNETTPGITPDGLTIFVASNRSGGIGPYDLWFSTRPSKSGSWSTPQLVSTINTVESESGPCPAADLLTITYSSRISGDWDIYQSTRASTSAAWGTPVPLSPLNSTDADGDPWLVGYLLVFGSTRSGDYDLYFSIRSGASFTAPGAIGSLNTSSDDTDPWLSPDLRTIIFASDRSGDWDLYIATR